MFKNNFDLFLWVFCSSVLPVTLEGFDFFFFLPPKTSLYIGDMGPLSVLYDAHRFSQLVIFLSICLMLFFAKQKFIFIVVIFINHLFWIFELKLPFLYIEVVYRRVPLLVFALFFFLTVIPAVPLGWVLGCGVRSLCPVDCPVVHNPFTVKRLSSPQWLGIPGWNYRFLWCVSGIFPSHRSVFLFMNQHMTVSVIEALRYLQRYFKSCFTSHFSSCSCVCVCVFFFPIWTLVSTPWQTSLGFLLGSLYGY